MLILLLATIFAILSQFLLIFKKYDICSHCVPIASSLHLKCLLFQAGLQHKVSTKNSKITMSWWLGWKAIMIALKCLLFQAGLQLWSLVNQALYWFLPLLFALDLLEMPAFPGGIATNIEVFVYNVQLSVFMLEMPAFPGGIATSLGPTFPRLPSFLKCLLFQAGLQLGTHSVSWKVLQKFLV